jgi:N6-adenosine-specific RNA methylase IME4
MANPLRADVDPSPFVPLPTIDGGFQTVMADPPWRFTNRTGKVAPEHRRLDRYDTMDLEAIKALPVSDHVADNAHLYLWVPNALLPEGMDVMKAWGFRYVSTELILFGVRGRMRTLPPARSQVNMIETRKREHSRKPDEQYSFIESCSPGPYLEMFARQAQPGWQVWGNEADVPEVRGKVHRGYQGGEINAAYATA